jgi:hypothetical protein
LYNSCVLGLHPSALFEMHYINYKKSYVLTKETVKLLLIQYYNDQNESRTHTHTNLMKRTTQNEELSIRNDIFTLQGFETPNNSFGTIVLHPSRSLSVFHS